MIDDPSFHLPVFYPIENKQFRYQKHLEGWAYSSQRQLTEELVTALEVAKYWKERYEKADEFIGQLKLKELDRCQVSD